MLDTTAESFLNVLRRFISQRRKSDLIWSDNATSFKLSQKTIEQLTTPKGVGQNHEEFLAHNKIKWKFIAQISPWAGGVYERLVQLCKNCFKRTLGRRILKYDELNTFMAEVEATLNHRPITVVSDGEDGIQPLRPIDLLQPDLQINWEITAEEAHPNDKQISSSERFAALFKATREAHESFWHKWHNDYLLLLREREKWDHKGPHLQDKGEPKRGMIAPAVFGYNFFICQPKPTFLVSFESPKCALLACTILKNFVKNSGCLYPKFASSLKTKCESYRPKEIFKSL